MPTQKKKTKEEVKVVTPQMLVRSHENTVKRSLKQHQLEQFLTVHFEGKPRPPIIGRIGVWLVNRAGGTIVTKYRFNDTLTSKESPTKE